MSASRLEAFLAKLYVDDGARAQFLANPRGEALKAGLDDEGRRGGRRNLDRPGGAVE